MGRARLPGKLPERPRNVPEWDDPPLDLRRDLRPPPRVRPWSALRRTPRLFSDPFWREELARSGNRDRCSRCGSALSPPCPPPAKPPNGWSTGGTSRKNHRSRLRAADRSYHLL